MVSKRSQQDSIGELQNLLCELESYERTRNTGCCPICVCPRPFCRQTNAEYVELTDEEIALIRAHRCAKAYQSLSNKCNVMNNNNSLQQNSNCCNVCGRGICQNVGTNFMNSCNTPCANECFCKFEEGGHNF